MWTRAPFGSFRSSTRPPSRCSQQSFSPLLFPRSRQAFGQRELLRRGSAAARKQGRCYRQRACAMTGHSLEPLRRSTAKQAVTRCSGGSTVQNAPAGGKDFFAWLLDLPWKRVGIWALVGMLAYQLSEFFGIFMGTFVLAFIGNGFVRSAEDTALLRLLPTPWRRRSLVATYFLSIVSLLIIFGVMTIPDIIREGADFIQRLKSDNIWVVVLDKMRHGLGDSMMDQFERFLLVASGDELSGSLAKTAHQAWTPDRTSYLGQVLSRMLRSYTDSAITLTTNLVSFVSRFAIQVGVSLVLSFMVLWDLPTISAGVSSLSTSRVAPVYKEIAPPFAVFGQLFGKALQAQARIAGANTLLTAVGIWALSIPGVGLLSLFVFICSFIPIAGVFISTIPICFVALTEYGFVKLALVVGMVTGIHFVEAYGLNPVIYSSHLKLHPLLVLTVLVFAEHSVGIWGLLLAVPLTVFTLDYCIRYPTSTVEDVAAKELMTVTTPESVRNSTSEARYVPPSMGIRGAGKLPQLE